MNREVFNDSAMLEIFRAEVETHVESLTAGLLALERDPGDTSHIDEMMRAAHSVKGAARIVGIDPAVKIAHVMEDGFIAAQKGELTLRPAHVDVLLRGVDMLGRVANGSKDPEIDWTRFDAEVEPLVDEITAALSGKTPPPAPVPAAPAQAAAPPAAPTVTPPQQAPSIPVPQAVVNDVTITIPAFLDASAAETARQAFVAALNANAAIVRFDLSLTTDLDATGLALLAAVPPCAGSHARVELAGVRRELRTVLQATGIEQLYSTGAR